jgi:hypothetical protein
MIQELIERARRIPASYFDGRQARFVMSIGQQDVTVDLGSLQLRLVAGDAGGALFHARVSEEDFAALRAARTDVMTLVNTGRIAIARGMQDMQDPPLKFLQFVIMLLLSTWYLTEDIVEAIERPRQAYTAGPPLPRVARWDSGSFADHASAGRPVLITGLAQEWDIRRHGIDHLIKIGDTIQVSLLTREHGAGQHAAYETSTLGDYIRRVRNHSGAERNFPYLAANAVPPELVKLTEAPHFFPRTAFANTRMWIGPPGTGLDLHRDMVDNFIVQVLGRKRVTLTPPHFAAMLEPRPLGGNPLYQPSGLFLLGCAGQEMPMEAASAAFDAVLEEGDTLYLPAGWWHRVHNETLSWSFNFFAVNQPPRVLGHTSTE